MEIREERMAPHLLKVHLGGRGVVHYMTAPDHGDPHDHPWPFVSTILTGGYIEEVFAHDGTSELVHRRPGDRFTIGAGHIHRIVELPEGECLTFIIPGEAERKPGFYQWRDGVMWSRRWDEGEFTPHG